MKQHEFRRGQKWRMVREGASLWGMQPIAPFAQTSWSMKLPVGTILTCDGSNMTFGDGVPIIKWRDENGAFLANDCEFKPSTGGMWASAPADGYLQLIESGLKSFDPVRKWSWMELRAAIEAYNYRYDNFDIFERDCGDDLLIERAKAHRPIGQPNMVVWDPQDDEDGWLLISPNGFEILIETAARIAEMATEGPLSIGPAT